MDQRELEANVRALTKSIQANEPPENAIRLLATLKKDAFPTEEMLRVRQDSCSPFASLCPDLWKLAYFRDLRADVVLQHTLASSLYGCELH